MTGRRAISAWVVYWDWIGENAEVRDRVVCLLPPRWEPARVAPVVETLYASTHYTLAEFASHVRRRDANPYPAEVTESARVICGHNPFLVAVKVKSLRVSTDPRTRLERIEWQTLPCYRMVDGESRLVSVGYSMSLERTLRGAALLMRRK